MSQQGGRREGKSWKKTHTYVRINREWYYQGDGMTYSNFYQKGAPQGEQE